LGIEGNALKGKGEFQGEKTIAGKSAEKGKGKG